MKAKLTAVPSEKLVRRSDQSIEKWVLANVKIKLTKAQHTKKTEIVILLKALTRYFLGISIAP